MSEEKSASVGKADMRVRPIKMQTPRKRGLRKFGGERDPQRRNIRRRLEKRNLGKRRVQL